MWGIDMEIDKNLNDIETKFNIAGAIPIVALFSGSLRAFLGKVQCITGIGIGIIGLIGQMFSNEIKWEHFAYKGTKHAFCGALNFFRGAAELLVGCTIVGSPMFGMLMGMNPTYPYGDKTTPLFHPVAG